MKALKVGVVGLGNIGSVHARCIHQNEVSRLVLTAVCDIDTKKLEQYKDTLRGITPFEDYKKMICSGEIDAVIIATPHYLHEDVAIYAFSKGLHVLTEKPAAAYTLQSERMNLAASKSGKVFSIMLNQRVANEYIKTRELFRNGEIGDLCRFDWTITSWFRTQSYYDSGTWRATYSGEGGGVLLNQALHNLDVLQWIIGMPDYVIGFSREGRYHNIEVEDDVTAIFEYKNGSLAVFKTSTGESPGINRMEITGTKGKIIVEGGSVKLFKLNTSLSEFIMTHDGFGEPKSEFIEFKDFDSVPMHKKILQNFTNAVLDDEQLIASGQEGLYSLMLANAINYSSWLSNERIPLPLDGEKYFTALQEKIQASSINPISTLPNASHISISQSQTNTTVNSPKTKKPSSSAKQSNLKNQSPSTSTDYSDRWKIKF